MQIKRRIRMEGMDILEVFAMDYFMKYIFSTSKKKKRYLSCNKRRHQRMLNFTSYI